MLGLVVAHMKRYGFRCTEGPHAGLYQVFSRLPVRIGRLPENQIMLPDDRTVSRHHAVLEEAGEGLRIRDLDSRTGTFVNGKRISSPVDVGLSRDLVQIGRSAFRLEPVGGGETLSAATMDEQDVQEFIAGSSMRRFPVEYLPGKPEVLLVTDVCKSTEFIERYGNRSFLVLMSAMMKLLRHKSDPRELLFLKCTGDGFMATFGSADHALEVAAYLLKKLARLSSEQETYEYPGVRVGLHRGELHQDPSGDRIGRDAHLAFRLQAVTEQDRVGSQSVPLPLKDRILASEAFVSAIADAGRKAAFRYCGEVSLKGFGAPVGAYVYSSPG